MRVFLTGGTGLIGTAVCRALVARGDLPVVLSRNARRAAERLGPEVLVVEGDPGVAGGWAEQLEGCGAVINLAGEPLFGRRWNAAQKERLRASRVDATATLVRAILTRATPPRVLVSASAIGIYGSVPEGELTEAAPAGRDFLAQTCAAWEEAAMAAGSALRVAIVRVGVVLASDGGALRQMLLPFRLGLGGPVGWGRQWVSWIHLEDVVRVFLAATDDAALSGPLNATAPLPVRNLEFSQCLARALRRPCLFPVPPPMLRLTFGEVAEVVISGQRVVPRRLEEAGFTFCHPTCQGAMDALFRPTPSAPAGAAG